MFHIPRDVAEIKPSAHCFYFDKITIWVKRPIDPATEAWLRKHCGSIDVRNRPARFGRGYRQRIELKQPSRKTLQWIASRKDALINQVEITVDFIFGSLSDLIMAFEFLHRHLVRRRHGKRQEIRLYRTGPDGRHVRVYEIEIARSRYDAGRWRPNLIMLYRELHCRVSGELNSLHLEWRASGARAVRALGIKTGQDLVDFDHRDFWDKRLLRYEVNFERLGRLIRSRGTGRRTRAATTGRVNRPEDRSERKIEDFLMRTYGTVQELVDAWKSKIRIHRALVPVSNQNWFVEQPPGVHSGGN